MSKKGTKQTNTGRAAQAREKSAPARPEQEPHDADRLADAVFSKPIPKLLGNSEALRFFRKVAPTLAFGIILYVILSNLNHVSGAFSMLLSAMGAVLAGIAIAFVLNIPLRALEGHVFRWIRSNGLRRGLSMLCCYIMLAALLLVIVGVAMPQMALSLHAIGRMLPEFGRELSAWIDGMFARLHLDRELISNIELDWNSLARRFVDITTSSMPQLLSTTRSITNGITEMMIGFVLSAYMLADKERIAAQGKRLCRSALRPDWAERVISLCSLAQTTFRGYISGIMKEACILGALTAGLMTLFGFPMPALAGILMGIGALVPIFGIFVMITTNTLMVAAQTNIYEGLWFLLFIVALQQLEGNLIFPRVMGSSIRLPGIWVLIAATVGGMLFGLVGLLISVPCMSMLYSLARAFVESRERSAARGEARPEVK